MVAMLHLAETKPQTWRAVAVFKDCSECLLCLGRSSIQLRDSHAAAFAAVLDGAERARVRCVRLECWRGAPDRGRWVPRSELPVPASAPPARLPGGAA